MVPPVSAEGRQLPSAACPRLKPRGRLTTVGASPVPRTSAVVGPDEHSLQMVLVMSPRAVVMWAVVMRAAATSAARSMVAAGRNPPDALRFSCTPPPEQQRE
ncbi:MAG TPA: hypothetical protein VKA59_25225 [Vicinamibacterales bacterium]|nr:hypothetical protein [Vicinamibacterales bacterium]